MTNRTITALLCGAILAPLLVGGWLVQRKLHPTPPVDTLVGEVRVVVHQPGYEQRMARDSARRDSLRRDSIAHHR